MVIKKNSYDLSHYCSSKIGQKKNCIPNKSWPFVCETLRLQLLSAGDGYADAADRFEKGHDHSAVMDGAGELLVDVDLYVGDTDVAEAEAQLFPDAGGDFGVPEVVRSGEAVELRAVLGEELVLGGGGHGHDGVGSGAGDLRCKFSAGEH